MLSVLVGDYFDLIWNLRSYISFKIKDNSWKVKNDEGTKRCEKVTFEIPTDFT